jgi:Zn-dependent protease
MNWSDIVLWFGAITISLTFHEAAHALFALLGGDRTAYLAGQVSLNPLPHMRREPFGMVLLPIATLLLSNGQQCLGFAHAPIDPVWAARHPKQAALMSAAGPLANVLLAAIAFAVLWFIGRPESDAETAVRKIAFVFLALNLLLALFNLVPLPPLDGAGILRGLWPRSGRALDTIANIPYGTLVVILLASRYVGELFWPVFATVAGWLPYPYR